MLRKIVLGVAAAAAVSAAALSPTTASAKSWGWHPHHFHSHFHGGGFYGVGYVGGGCYERRLVPTPFGLRARWVNVCY